MLAKVPISCLDSMKCTFIVGWQETHVVCMHPQSSPAFQISRHVACATSTPIHTPKSEVPWSCFCQLFPRQAFQQGICPAWMFYVVLVVISSSSSSSSSSSIGLLSACANLQHSLQCVYIGCSFLDVAWEVQFSTCRIPAVSIFSSIIPNITPTRAHFFCCLVFSVVVPLKDEPGIPVSE